MSVEGIGIFTPKIRTKILPLHHEKPTVDGNQSTDCATTQKKMLL